MLYDLPTPGSGGVATLVSKRLCPNFDRITFTALALGRVSRTSIQLGASSVHRASDGELVVYDVHNYDISRMQPQLLSNTYTSDCERLA